MSSLCVSLSWPSRRSIERGRMHAAIIAGKRPTSRGRRKQMRDVTGKIPDVIHVVLQGDTRTVVATSLEQIEDP